MFRRTFLSAAASAPLFGKRLWAQDAAKPRPLSPANAAPLNVLLIVADDLGVGDLGCYGQKIIRTPHLDQLAAEGARFTNAYAGASISAYSRCVLLTGKQPGFASVRVDQGGVPLEPGDVTVAELLAAKGYLCGAFGIWGLGEVATTGHPNQQGFEKFFGYLHGQHAHQKYPGFLFDDTEYYAFDTNRLPEQNVYVQEFIYQSAMGHLDRARRKQKPTFTYAAFSLPSPELQAPYDDAKVYEGKFPEVPPYNDPREPWLKQKTPRTHYAAMVSKLDAYVGQLLAYLKEQKLEENTLVIVTSDQGSAAREWDPQDLFGSLAGLRGGRGSLYEGGLRVPLLVRWPGKIPAGAVLSLPVSGQDIMPTILEAAGLTTTETNLGVSLLPDLFAAAPAGKSSAKPKKSATKTPTPAAARPGLYWELPVWFKSSGRFANEVPPQAVRMGNWKAVRPQPNGPWELYDLAKDPAEATNVAAQQTAVVQKIEAFAQTSRVAPRVQKLVPSLHFR